MEFVKFDIFIIFLCNCFWNFDGFFLLFWKREKRKGRKIMKMLNFINFSLLFEELDWVLIIFYMLGWFVFVGIEKY